VSDEPAPDEFEYDVAISCLGTDADTAAKLAELLCAQLRVFLYVHRQQELAGTDGLVSFREVFRTKARLVVVLFRAAWGTTKWTRVEQEAITDRFLSEGGGFLFWVMLDAQSKPPPWVPDRLLRFSLADYGMEQAVGAIKNRVQEAGGSFHEESVAERARRAAASSAFAEETRRLHHSEHGVAEVRASAHVAVVEVARLIEEAKAAAPGLELRIALAEAEYGENVAVSSARVSLVVNWRNTIINSVDDAPLLVRMFGGRIILPGENLRYLHDPPGVIDEREYDPVRLQSMGWCWRRRKDEPITSPKLASEAVGLLLEHLG